MGIAALEQMLARAEERPDKTLDGADAFKLYDTYGMPLDMLNEIAEEREVTVDSTGFEREMGEQRRRARESWKKTSVAPDKAVYGELRDRFKTRFLGYETTFVEETRVLALIRDGSEVSELNESEEGEIFLDNDSLLR